MYYKHVIIYMYIYEEILSLLRKYESLIIDIESPYSGCATRSKKTGTQWLRTGVAAAYAVYKFEIFSRPLVTHRKSIT